MLLAPYVSMPTRLRNIASMFWAIDACVPYLRGRGGERSIHDPAERALSRAYGVVTGRLAFELSRVVKRARHALPRIAAPTLVIQSRRDNRIARGRRQPRLRPARRPGARDALAGRRAAT